jgi:hypothetical protein
MKVIGHSFGGAVHVSQKEIWVNIMEDSNDIYGGCPERYGDAAYHKVNI